MIPPTMPETEMNNLKDKLTAELTLVLLRYPAFRNRDVSWDAAMGAEFLCAGIATNLSSIEEIEHD